MAADITYLPISPGSLYFVAIIDWASRAVLAWRLSNTMDLSFCVAALEEALAKYGTPEIFNIDQASSPTRPSAARWRRTDQDLYGSSSGCGGRSSMRTFIWGYAEGREAKAGVASWTTNPD